MADDRHIVMHGPPITPELQQVFGMFGELVGIVILDKGRLYVQYRDGSQVLYTPEKGRLV
jgi:hypothetical protein